jgi:hypothetical protein
VSFIENRGQVDRRVAYYAHGGSMSLFFTRRGVTLGVARGGGKPEGWAVQQAFLGTSGASRPHASRPERGVVSYFSGPRAHWKTGLRTYRRLVYRDVWPGIDVAYRAKASGLEYSFLIRPGADPEAIRLAYHGASGLRSTRIGGLEVSTPLGRFKEHRPVAYQRIGGARVPVRAAFALSRAGAGRARRYRYGFDLGAYDAGRPIVIDPVVFGYSGFIGGSGDDQAFDTAVDRNGNAYVTGSTMSLDFPATPGPLSTFSGARDAFVAKLNRSGSLVYADYLGGMGDEDVGRGIAIDQADNAYIAGPTDSPPSSFPVTVGPDLTLDGAEDAFVAKVNPTGTKLLYAGYIGGDKGEGGRDIAVDGNGNAYVAATTNTADSTFPAKVGPDLTYGGGNHDGFVAKVNPTGSDLAYCSYIGGDGNEDNVRGVAVDTAGNLYLTGHADSSQTTLPVTVGPDLTYNGNNDGYVAKIDPTGTQFVYFGYVGGSEIEQPRHLDIDANGNAYIAGSTQSTESSFPVTVGPDLTHNGGTRDGFVTKVKADGTGLVYSGYIGGAGDDQIYGLAVDGGGNAYVAGLTNSSEATFPVAAGPDVLYNGGQDGFAAKVNAAGTGLDYAGYVGGTGYEVAQGIGVDTAGNAYVSGATGSSEASFPTTGPPDPTFNGGSLDAFVTKVVPIKGAHVTVGLSGPAHAGAPFTVTAVMRDSSNQPVTQYNAPAAWTSTDGGITPAAPAGFVQGVSTTDATIGVPFHGDRITVSSSGVSGQSSLFNVLGPLDHIAISGVPASVSVGESFTVRATAKDSLSDTITDYAAPATWSDRSGSLTPASPADFANGVSSTSAQVGVPYHDDRITLTSGGVSGNSALFNVAP